MRKIHWLRVDDERLCLHELSTCQGRLAPGLRRDVYPGVLSKIPRLVDPVWAVRIAVVWESEIGEIP